MKDKDSDTATDKPVEKTADTPDGTKVHFRRQAKTAFGAVFFDFKVEVG